LSRPVFSAMQALAGGVCGCGHVDDGGQFTSPKKHQSEQCQG